MVEEMAKKGLKEVHWMFEKQLPVVEFKVN